MPDATFYTVNGPRGVYYSVRNHASGKVWTERTELAARQQADDEGLTLVASATIDHIQLLDLMIPQSTAVARQDMATAGSNEPTKPSLRIETGLTRFFKRFRRDHTSMDRRH